MEECSLDLIFLLGQLDHKSTKTQSLCHTCLQDQSSKINPDAHVSIKINTFTLYKGGLGAIAPRSQRSVKMEAFPFLHQILQTRPVIMWIQIRARGSGGIPPPRICFIKIVQCGALNVFQN